MRPFSSRSRMIDTAQILARTGGRALRRIVYSPEQIHARVREMGEEIARYYPEGENILLVGLLKGSFIFVGDLVREIARPLQVDFLVAASYGSGTTSSGELTLLYDPEAELRDRHVLLVEDIVDSGLTLSYLRRNLMARAPASLEVCALLVKEGLQKTEPDFRYVGFRIPPAFVVGYGLDMAERYRNLPYICSWAG